MATEDAATDADANGGDTGHFMRLPLELRLNIYEHALSATTIETGKFGSGLTHTLPLLLTCKTIRHEATEPYWFALTTSFRAQWVSSIERSQERINGPVQASASGSPISADEEYEGIISTLWALASEMDQMCKIFAREWEVLRRERTEGKHTRRIVALPDCMQGYKAKIDRVRQCARAQEKSRDARRAERNVSEQA